ncbi:hypothetical protein LTR47_004707 [Exophiala xenobiotica]|nr:hypothetical protein LTR41_005395 [Exophiala xenobiotica]KAK5234116.1 hypothetical protein LTR47_004707 [Exophiala xenobiotica]KAK5253187.1 hypothetical protein LTS06_002393 [Exophiala xenobiotica]KAK5283179.1 hypothetical protein LTR40_002181 [Exophiala xenobiotica]KAK5325080.1 hypothetical protein LTR93_004557 [Exophiala xenobiotica]
MVVEFQAVVAAETQQTTAKSKVSGGPRAQKRGKLRGMMGLVGCAVGEGLTKTNQTRKILYGCGYHRACSMFPLKPSPSRPWFEDFMNEICVNSDTLIDRADDVKELCDAINDLGWPVAVRIAPVLRLIMAMTPPPYLS